MKIAIAGCGITGTTAAYFLAKAGHDVTIFERSPVSRPVGAGIMIQPSGQEILREMKLLDEVESCSSRLVGMTARLTSGKPLVKLRFAHLCNEFHALGVHRGRLFGSLLNACRNMGVEILNGCPVSGYESLNSSPSKLLVKLESSAAMLDSGEFDFLIGADGIKSAVRHHLESQRLIRTRFTEYDFAALWMTNRTEYQSDELLQVVEGTRRLIGLLPIGSGECSFFWGLRTSEFDNLRDSSFEKWKSGVLKDCPAAELLLHNIQSFDQLTFGRYGHVQVSRMATDRVILLGDAAHATSPHLGQGANLGLEDAFQFGLAIKQTGDFRDACEIYLKRQTAKIRYYQQLTRFLSPFFQSQGWFLGQTRNLFLPWFPHLPFVGKQMLRTLCGLKRGWLS